MSPPCRFLKVSEEATRNPSSSEAKNAIFCTFRNLSFDRSTTEDIPLYLTSFTGKKSSKSQGKGHCQLLPKDWKTASHALTGDPLAPQQPRVAMGRHYAYAPLRTPVFRALPSGLNFRAASRLRSVSSSLRGLNDACAGRRLVDLCFQSAAGCSDFLTI